MQFAALTITMLIPAITATLNTPMQHALGIQDASVTQAEVKAPTSFFFTSDSAAVCNEFDVAADNVLYALKAGYKEGNCASRWYTIPSGSKKQFLPIYPNSVGRMTTVYFFTKVHRQWDDSILAELLDEHNKKDIVSTVEQVKTLSTLMAAIKDAGLVSMLESGGPFTIFAPNNDAFAKLPVVALKKLLQPQNTDKLKAILTYHVVKGSIHAKDLRDGETVTTLEGLQLRVKVNRAGVFVGGAKVLAADVDASNGVIHTIDSVLLMPRTNMQVENEWTDEEKDQIEFILATTSVNFAMLGSRCHGDPSRDPNFRKAFGVCLKACNAAQGWATSQGVNPRCFQCCHDNYCFGTGSPTDLKCGCNGFDCRRRSHRSAGCDTCSKRYLRL